MNAFVSAWICCIWDSNKGLFLFVALFATSLQAYMLICWTALHSQRSFQPFLSSLAVVTSVFTLRLNHSPQAT